MKNKSLYLLLLLVAFSGCDFGFIDRPQLAVQTSDSFYKTADDAKSAVTAVYNYFQKYDFEVSKFEFGDIASDDAEKGGESDNDRPFVKDLEYFRTRSDNYSCMVMWKICFKAIYQANYAIENIKPIDMDANLKERFIAEVSFIRAHFYLGLNTFADFGRVTKMVDVKSKIIARSSIPQPDYFNWDAEKMHVSYGAGLRIVMNENFVIAADYGLAADEQDGKSGFYMGLNYIF